MGRGGFSDVRSLRKLPSRAISGQEELASHSSLDDHRSYALKQLRGSLSQSMKLVAAVDLAKEARFLSTLSHPK